MGDADDNLQGLATHDSADVNDVSNSWVAPVELDQDVGGVGREDAECDDWGALSSCFCVYTLQVLLVMIPGIKPIVCSIAGRLRIPMPTWLVKKIKAVYIDM